MRRFFVSSALVVLVAVSAGAWGRIGHASVAALAQKHLTPRTKACIDEILKGESIISYASYADEYKAELLFDYGVNFKNGDPRVNTLPHTFEVNMDFVPVRGYNEDRYYVKNCLYFIKKYAEDLSCWKELDDSTRFTELVLMVHFLGDMHCPEHIRYNPEDMSIGHLNVTYQKQTIQYHKFWDESLITSRFTSYSDFVGVIEARSPSTVAEYIKGDVYDWGHDSAKCSWPVHAVKDGDVIKKEWTREFFPLACSQLSKAGYRLAHILNMTFDPKYAKKHSK